MAQSTLKSSVKCPDCLFEFKFDVELKHKNYWTKEDQLSFHRDHKCAIFDFSKSINYAFFRPIQDKNVILPIDGLPNEIGNFYFVYTGETCNGYLFRPLNQLFMLYDVYHKKTAKTKEEIKYSEIYQQTVINSKIGLCLMIVRSSDNHAEIETSEYNMIYTFRSHANSLFYNQLDGTNSLNYNYDQLIEMKRENYRRIQFKVENKYYLKFTDAKIKELRNVIPLAKDKRNYTPSMLATKIILEKILTILYELNPSFFKNQEPDKSNLKRESFFERKNLLDKEDALSIFERIFSYRNGNWRNDNEIGKRLAAHYNLPNNNI